MKEFLESLLAILDVTKYIVASAMASSIVSILRNHIRLVNDTLSKIVSTGVFSPFWTIYSKIFQRVMSGKSDKLDFDLEFKKVLQTEINKATEQFIKEYSKTIKEDTVQPSIIGLLAIKRSRNNLYASGLLLITMIAHEVIIYKFGYSLINSPFIVMVFYLILIAVDEYLLYYRVKKGYFGTNKTEAKQIINFILKNSNTNNNFKGPDGNIKVFDEILNTDTESDKGYDFGLNPSLG